MTKPLRSEEERECVIGSRMAYRGVLFLPVNDWICDINQSRALLLRIR